MTEAATPTETTADAPVLGAPGDYLKLLKPRVMSLVIFTALTGMICSGGKIDVWSGAIALFCIAVGAGASGALNMAHEAEIDAKMKRTKRRPTATGLIKPTDAAAFGIVLSLFSVGVLGLVTGYWLAAGLLAFTIFFYAVIYTRLLKLATPQNIVIGGAAGALPPVVGWAAASGQAPWQAWLLFAIIFLWTPPHFWALGLYTTEDYAKAGVPMLPVVKGAKSTRLQILLYSLVLGPVGAIPGFVGLGGPAYRVVSILGGIAMIVLAVRIFLSTAGDGRGVDATGLYQPGQGAKSARDLFAVSIAYLFLLFAVLLVEHLPLWPHP